MKTLSIVLTLIFSILTPVYAGIVDDISKTVVFLKQQRPQRTVIDGNTAEMFYRLLGTEEYKPISEVIIGSGFIIRHQNRDYLVTAKHVAKEMSPTGEIIVNLKNGKFTVVTFQALSEAKNIIPEAHWFHHATADISIHPICYPPSIDVMYIPEDIFQKDNDEIQLLNKAYIVGFPMGFGVLDKLSPIAKEAKLASKLTSIADPRIPKDLHFYLLDQALSQGYSGAPVFYVEDVTATNVTPKIKIGEKIHLLGLQSSAYSDKTGGKISLVVPISYIIEIFESSDFQAYEKNLKEKK